MIAHSVCIYESSLRRFVISLSISSSFLSSAHCEARSLSSRSAAPFAVRCACALVVSLRCALSQRSAHSHLGIVGSLNFNNNGGLVASRRRSVVVRRVSIFNIYISSFQQDCANRKPNIVNVYCLVIGNKHNIAAPRTKSDRKRVSKIYIYFVIVHFFFARARGFLLCAKEKSVVWCIVEWEIVSNTTHKYIIINCICVFGEPITDAVVSHTNSPRRSSSSPAASSLADSPSPKLCVFCFFA